MNPMSQVSKKVQLIKNVVMHEYDQIIEIMSSFSLQRSIKKQSDFCDYELRGNRFGKYL